MPILSFSVLYRRGKKFALRDRLSKADAIIVLAGSRGSREFLQSKVRTAAHLYHQGWAPRIIFVGKFSKKVDKAAKLITLEELREAVKQGRIQEKDVALAAETWDVLLGAGYMRDLALKMGVPEDATLIEEESLHTLENATHTLCLLQEHKFQKVILVTTPFHQLRTYLTFAKVFQPHGIAILNYYANTGEWHPLTWFFSKKNRDLVNSEIERIKIYRKKGDIL